MPTIETARLRLRHWTAADIEAWAAMNADPRVMEYFHEVMPAEQSRAQALRMDQELHKNGYGWFVLERKEEPGFAGVIALADVGSDLPFAPAREIGWRLPTVMWGHGYATEAAHALMDHAFTKLKWTHIVSMTAVINHRSRRVMERLGMTHDPHENFDHPRVPDGHALKHHVLYRKSSA